LNIRYRLTTGILVGFLALLSAERVAWPAPVGKESTPPPRISGRLHANVGSLSFNGMTVVPGETSPAQDVVVSSPPGRSLLGLRAEAHGDFVILRNTCLEPAAAVKSGPPECIISVAFRPLADGARNGDLTISAEGGAFEQVVALAAGTPILLPSSPSGGSVTSWITLPAPVGALTASADGPISIALQTSYVYDSISGITFGSTAHSTGQCAAGVTNCQVFLGIRSLTSAPQGQSPATVRLSNGMSYQVTVNVLSPGLSISPSVVDVGTLYALSRSEPKILTITNDNKTPVALGNPATSGPFSVTNKCGMTLEPGASCTMQVFFSPTATGAATGVVQIPTNIGSLAVGLAGTGLDNPASVRFNPGTLDFSMPPPPPGTSFVSSAPRTLSIANLSQVPVQIGAPTDVTGTRYDKTVANHCTTLAPQANCQIKFVFSANAESAPALYYNPSSIQVPVTPEGGQTLEYNIPTTAHNAISPPVTHLFTVFPTALQFPATPYGRSSPGRILTVTNTSALLLAIRATSDVDFAVDPSCIGLFPGKSCQLVVHYVPTVGKTLAGGTLTLKALDLTTATLQSGEGLALDTTTIALTGASINPAELKSPATPALTHDSPPDGIFEVTNQSQVPLKITDALSRVDCPDGVSPLAIPPGGHCRLDNPDVILSSNAVSSPDHYSIPGGSSVSFGASGAPAVVSLEPTLLGATSTGNVTVSIGGNDAYATAVILYPEVNENFTVTNQCPDTLQSVGVLQPGSIWYTASCNVVISFTPKSLGFHSGRLGLATDVGLQTLLLAGTAIAPAVAVSPAILNFNVQNGVNKPQAIVLKNTSSSAVPLAPALLTGPDASNFTLGPASCGTSIPAGGTCSIPVTYGTPANYSFATVVLSTPARNSLGSVLLRGLNVRLYSYTSDNPDFSASAPGVQLQATFTVRSSGPPITLGNASFSGTGAGAFSLLGGSTCTKGLVVQGDTTCRLVVQWTSQAYGEVDIATLNLASSAGPLAIALEGATERGP
jgi:hypothetical protein